MALRLISATIKVDDTEYTEEIQDYSWDPTNTTTSVTDVSGKVHKFSADESDWALTMNVFQNFAASGFARKCFDSPGVKVEVIVVDGPVTWTAEIDLVAPKIGGAAKTVGLSPLVFPSTKPVPTATAGG